MFARTPEQQRLSGIGVSEALRYFDAPLSQQQNGKLNGQPDYRHRTQQSGG